MVTDEAIPRRDVGKQTKDSTQGTLAARHTRTLRFSGTQPARGGLGLTPPVGIWRSLVDVNALLWRR
jgi:hypothetical protein